MGHKEERVVNVCIELKNYDIEKMEQAIINSLGQEGVESIQEKEYDYEIYDSHYIRWIAKRYPVDKFSMVTLKICDYISSEDKEIFSVEVSGTLRCLDLFLTNTSFNFVGEVEVVLCKYQLL